MKTLNELIDERVEMEQVHWRNDVQTIMSVARTRMDILLSPLEAERIWQWHSDSACAGWLGVTDDEEIVYAINAYVESRTGPTE